MALPIRAQAVARVLRGVVRGGGHGGHGHASHDAAAHGHGSVSPAMAAYQAQESQLYQGTVSAHGGYEYWQTSFYIVAGTCALTTLAYPYFPNTNIQDWARDEAEERARRRAAGLEVEYGVNYAARRMGSGFKHVTPTSFEPHTHDDE